MAMDRTSTDAIAGARGARKTGVERPIIYDKIITFVDMSGGGGSLSSPHGRRNPHCEECDEFAGWYGWCPGAYVSAASPAARPPCFRPVEDRPGQFDAETCDPVDDDRPGESDTQSPVGQGPSPPPADQPPAATLKNRPGGLFLPATSAAAGRSSGDFSSRPRGSPVLLPPPGGRLRPAPGRRPPSLHRRGRASDA